MRLPQVDEGQHHEDERLQGDDQDVEDGPHRTGDDVPEEQGDAGTTERECATHQSGTFLS